ncbi:hypothetical protein [Aliifodinibius sp. S!AR15-10]|uniref:hypothetical protein n=1 Tax=Aliifodinibius sp. S!AR15-10 TaxID=2950437 RepID=UPI0028705C0B|nr:hypothetical protein [Aliifodinibius sp. S!AR15-10]
MYTPATGIWQTVWLEPVPQTSIDDVNITPDIDNSEVKLTSKYFRAFWRIFGAG